MSVKHSGIAQSQVLYSGRFDFDELYDFFFELLGANGYTLMDESFSQKIKDVGEKAEIMWSFEKLVDDYTKFVIKITFIATEMEDVIVKKGGSENKVNEGNLNIVVSGTIITDWQGKWEQNKFLEFLRGFYERYLFKATLDDYMGQVFNDVFLIESELKSFLKVI